MRLAELCGAIVRDTAGATLGRVHELYVKGGEVDALGVGAANLVERLFGRRRGRRIAWAKVVRIGKDGIVVEP